MTTAIRRRPSLTSAVLTQPVPLATGSGATLDIVISNGGQQPIHCDQIIVVIPVGDLAQDLLPPNQKIKASAQSTAGAWSFTQMQQGALEGIPDDEEFIFNGTTQDSYRATRQDNSVHAFTKTGLHLTLEIPTVNDEVGTASIEIRSHIRNSDDGNWRWEYSHHQLDKYPARANLTPVANLHIVEGEADSKKIVTQISRDKKFTLKWDGPDIAYTLYSPAFKNGHVEVTKGEKKEHYHTVDAGVVTRDTTFTLRAKSPSRHRKRDSYLTTTLTITEPKFPSMDIAGHIRAASITAGESVRSQEVKVHDEHGSVSIRDGKLTATKQLFSEGEIATNGNFWIKGKVIEEGST
ncbi:hypothetical protein [Streptomyces noursei]|uniref:hypothetical protein n=1 Tax=Streptomyces noursei TaxID=1971 RepID=UPI001676C452|nr:hypothetical protein [Streptomyces noursei]MCZ1021268.1 hypothetical protein [Streptomyces noursei]GGX54854.1 hypothetical protein GCM10010341_89860 [Streptomyces noursei]